MEEKEKSINPAPFAEDASAQKSFTRERCGVNYYQLLGAVLILGLIFYFGQIYQKISQPKENLIASTGSLIKNASAEEIYPLFLCPCCGLPLDKNNICCEMAEERINYIDSLAQTDADKNEIILAYVKKYGLNSLADKTKQEEIKEELTKTAPADRPIISLSPDFYDFKEVSQKQGKVVTYFDLKNEGETDLIITKLETSCGCTSASIVLNEEEGPIFNMPGHGVNEEVGDWQTVILPNQTAQLKVYYDPDVHPEFRGPATREISILSNDPINFEKKVTIELNQVD